MTHIERAFSNLIDLVDDTHKNAVLWGNELTLRSGPGLVYVIKGGDYIKIGFTQTSVEKRLTTLQTAAPFRLRVLFCFPGTLESELKLQNMLEPYSTIGEWFKYCPETHDLLNTLLQFLYNPLITYLTTNSIGLLSDDYIAQARDRCYKAVAAYAQKTLESWLMEWDQKLKAAEGEQNVMGA